VGLFVSEFQRLSDWLQTPPQKDSLQR